MKIVCIGGGPAGLFLAILMKRADAAHDVLVAERNRPDDTFGFGVVFSDETLDRIAEADPESFRDIERRFSRWDDIDIHFRGEVIRSTGHGFSGLSRQTLLDILQRRCSALDVRMQFQTDVANLDAYADADLIVAADGVNSTVRRLLADQFRPNIEWGRNRFVWLGTARRFPAFAFFFKDNEHGLWRVHAYNYDADQSTFIVECTEETWRRTGLGETDEDAAVAYCERLFAEELAGNTLLKNRSSWRRFPIITNARWAHERIVLVGDAAHTAHFSIGSGTKLAMEDAIDLAFALTEHAGVPAALSAYDAKRRPAVESTQRAARVSQTWFEEAERYYHRLQPPQFAFSLLTRSLRITHGNLQVRDPAFVNRVDQWFQTGTMDGPEKPAASSPPPMFTPLRLREMVLPNRIVVSPMCQYSAEDGTPNDWHLVHLGSRAVGGAGLVMTEMTDVSADARISPGCAGMYKPEHVDAWKRIVDFVHSFSTAKIGIQLGHAGRKGSTRLAWEGMDEPLQTGDWDIIGPSPISYFPHSQTPRGMTRQDMDRVREDFVRATRMSIEAGFDMIEIHAAHGYLLASFLSPLTNRRQDEYGGSPANRMRFPLEVFDAVRAVWPAERPISVRISATDWADGGFTGDDAVVFAKALRDRGCDIIDVSTGQTSPESAPVYGRLYQTPFSELIRLEAGIPTITVGNISSYADVNTILAAGRADLCALARAHLFDPYWTRHAAYEQGYELPHPDPYLSVAQYTPRFEWSVRGNDKGAGR